MADGERRMLFDIRGRRKNVVKVVYAILALLMAASLILLAGPGLFGGGGGGSSGEAAKQLEEQAERIERKLAKTPNDPNLQLSLMRTRISAANSQSEFGPAGEALPTVESREQLEKASAAWSDYLKQSKEPTAGAAQLITPALFSLAQTSRDYNEALDNISAASESQKIVADQRPSLGSLSTLALYLLFTGDYKAAEKALNEAMKFANTKTERESLETQFKEVKKRAQTFQKEIAESEKAAKQAGAAGGGEALQNPLGGLGGGSSLSE
jgi:tetratricopeptide (TPR) repeat protein